MSYQQVIASKVKLNGIMGMQHHLIDRDRVKTNPDIDLNRSRLNYFIEGLTAENLNSRVKVRIKQLNLKKRPRFDAVGLEDIVIKASPDFMLNIDAQTREHYFTDALHLIQFLWRQLFTVAFFTSISQAYIFKFNVASVYKPCISAFTRWKV